MKKCLSLTACMALLSLFLLLTACGEKAPIVFAEVTAEPLNANSELLSYRSRPMLSEVNTDMIWRHPCITSDGIYLFCYKVSLDIYDVYLFSVEGEIRRLNLSFDDGERVSGMFENDGVLWMLTSRYDDSAHGSVYSLCVFDGESMNRFPIEIDDEHMGFDICAAGDLVFINITEHNNDMGDILTAYSKDGQKVFEFAVGGYFQMASDGDTLYISARNVKENIIELSRLDIDRQELKPIASFDAGTLLSCRGDKLYFLDGSDTTVFEYDIATNRTARLFDLTVMGVSCIGTVCVLPYGEDDFIACDLENINLISAQTGAKRTPLVLAINAPAGRYSRAVLDFNETSDEYEVTIKNYSDYPNPQEILGAELASGKGPDIIDAASFSGDILQGGVMVDLIQYLSRDPEMGTEDLLQGPLRTMLTDGGEMYAIAPYFYVATLLCRAETAEAQPFAGVADALERLGSPDAAFGGTMSRGDFLALAFCCGDFEDFSREDIAAILEYSAALPETSDYSEEFENLMSGRQRFERRTLGSATHIQAEALNSFGETDVSNITIWGTPFREGTGVLIPEMYLAIPEGSPNKDAAWEFIKAMLRAEGDLDNEFPLLAANYEKSRQYAQTLIDDKVKMTYITKTGTGAEYVFENLDFFEASDSLLVGLGALCDTDSAIYPIICRCAEPYFEGSVSAEAAADSVISRVNLYLSEQYG